MEVIHDLEEKRFYSVVEAQTALMDYKIVDKKTLKYYHTFVPPPLRGKKVAAEIVKTALEYAKENNFKVIPSCPYVKKFITRHPEYQNLEQ